MLVSTLIELARKFADMEEGQFCTDQDILELLQDSYIKLYDELIATDEDYNVSSATINVVGGTQDYDLPTDFYKMKAIDWPIDSARNYSLRRFNFQERNSYSIDWKWRHLPCYHIINNTLRLTPNTETKIVTLWYIPLPITLTESTELTGIYENYKRYLALDSAIQMLNKEHSDTEPLLLERNNELIRIKRTLKNRDVGQPIKIINYRDM
jgi:hypothetical protein